MTTTHHSASVSKSVEGSAPPNTQLSSSTVPASYGASPPLTQPGTEQNTSIEPSPPKKVDFVLVYNDLHLSVVSYILMTFVFY
jgi:hypothetical protein